MMDTMTDASRLALLLADMQCRDTVLAAADAVDRQDYAALAALFTPDATLVRPGAEPLKGRDAIFASYASKNPDRLTQHLVCNHRVQVDLSGRAQSHCKVLLYVGSKSQELTAQGRLADSRHQVGQIVDQLVITADGWRIQERRAWFDLQVI